MSQIDETQAERIAKFKEAGFQLLVAEARDAPIMRKALQDIIALYPDSEAAKIARAALAGPPP